MLESKTLRLGDEVKRLDGKLDDLATTLQNADDGADTSAIRARAGDVESQYNALLHLIDEHGADATVTISGLTAGDYYRVKDKTAAIRDDIGQSGQMPGTRELVFAAGGLTDAPFLADGADFDERIRTLGDQPVGVPDWVAGHASDLSTNSHEDFRGLDARLADSSES